MKRWVTWSLPIIRAWAYVLLRHSARMQYRSKPKHEMKLFTFKTEKPLQPGQRLLAKDGDVELGEVVDFSLLDKNTYLLAASVIFDCPADFVNVP